MFKIVPKTNNLYEMSIEGIIRRKDGLDCTLTSLNNEPAISLEMYGKERTVTIEWLRLITHFEVDLKVKDLFNIYFVDIYKWIYSNKVNKTMLFYGKPLEYKPGFRIIPEYTRYAVSQTGEVFDTECNVLVPSVKETNRYITITLYSADKGIYKNLLLHRLVALAWVKNPNHMEFYLVNHKDGNKHNPHRSNLEWTNHKGNIEHAYDNSLRSQNNRCKVRDIKTGEITEFNSFRDACLFMGVSPKAYEDFVRFNKGRAINGKYQIKLLADQTEWPVVIAVDDPFTATIIEIYDKNGHLLKSGSTKEIYSYLQIPLVSNLNRKQICSYCLKNNYVVKFINVRNDIEESRVIQVYNTVDQTILEFNNRAEVIKNIPISKYSVFKGLHKGESYLINGYAFRYKTDKKWNTNFSKAINIPKCILAINKNGKEYECDSTRIAERLTKVNRKAIQRALLGITINSDWHFKYK